MKATLSICCVLVALLGLSCAPKAGPEISLTEDSLSLSVTEVDGGVLIENLSGVACIVFFIWPDREEQFDFAVGQTQIVEGMPSTISAVKR